MDWNGVESAATELLAENENDPTSARALYANTLAAWVAKVEDAPQSEAGAEDQVVSLWMANVNMEKTLRQFKQAVKVFESAVTCSVAGFSSRIWLEYVQFCIERNKKSNTKKVFTRAVDSVKDEELGPVWDKFLAYLQVRANLLHLTPAF
jgi:hypothetical protein